MAFVLLLILSITSFVVVEQQSANIAKQRLAAKQNALVGLHIAIGELQGRLGPDQRATASADILGSSNNPYTLVWHSDPTQGWDSATNNWITGGDADFALPLLSVDPAKLNALISSDGKFNESVLDKPVELMTITKPSDGTLTSLKAERRPLMDAQGATTGNYAWVAQDESLKANLKTEHGDYQNTNPDLDLVETSRRLSVFPYANAAGIEIEGTLPFEAVDPVVNGELNDDYFEKIQKAEVLGDLITSGLLEPASKSGSKAEQLAPYRNHLTLNSKGVLADAKNGGLRRDLSRGLDDQYFEKLHGLPVFGIDADGNAADGINDPVGDQWKFFRDYYNFYRPVDDGLVEDIDEQNIFYGLSDVTDPNPSTRMRFTDANQAINFIYNSSNGTDSNDRSYNVSYAGPVTTLTVNARHYTRNNSYNFTDKSWFAFTPELRPVFLRKSIKIGIHTRQTTSADFTDPDDPNVGKYILQFKVYPSMILWNPFNVAIDLNPTNDGSSISSNPLANGEVIKFETVSGGIRFPIEVTKGATTESYSFDIRPISPRIIAVGNKAFDALGIPKRMGPGEVITFGLRDTYRVDLYNSGRSNNPITVKGSSIRRANGGSIDQNMSRDGWEARGGNWGSAFHLFPAASSYGVSEDNGIIYETSYLLDTNDDPIETYLDANDVIVILKSDKSVNAADEYSWGGRISGRKAGNSSPEHGYFHHLFDSFHQAQNSDLIYIDENVSLGTAAGLTNGDAFPFYQIDFRGRTLSDESGPLNSYGNPALPAFANVNYLGTMPLGLKGKGYDTWQDVKALYIPERMSINIPLDPLSERDAATGAGYYGSSFDNDGKSSSRITLYDIPRHPIVSAGDFKNLVFSWFEDAPARPIGASWPNATLGNLSDTYIKSHESGNSYGVGAGCDTSYHYNDTLFDSYFLSGIPSEERDNDSSLLLEQTFPYGQAFNQSYINDQEPLANTRLSYYLTPVIADFRDPVTEVSRNASNGFEKAAAHLMIDAPFNINSTSPKAWQAILSGFRSQSVIGVDQDYNGKTNYTGRASPFVDNFIPSGDDNDLYAGHRRLLDDQLANLSNGLIDEIRNRGVARTLGGFLNRSNNSSNSDEQLMSRIDKAILDAGLNTSQRIADSAQDDAQLISRPNETKPQAHMFAQSLAPETGAGLPGYLKQQDILRPLAPIMTSRGDTFTIRTYGETINPLTGKTEGKVWCEAVIQRVPDYLEATDAAWEVPTAASVNEKFGRRFKIVKFRWLSSDDVS
jgi:hypothetical protein